MGMGNFEPSEGWMTRNLKGGEEFGISGLTAEIFFTPGLTAEKSKAQ
jgi:hypothetical protein